MLRAHAEAPEPHLSLSHLCSTFFKAGGAQPIHPELGPALELEDFPINLRTPALRVLSRRSHGPVPSQSSSIHAPWLCVCTQGCLHLHLWQPFLAVNLSWPFITFYHRILQNWELFPQLCTSTFRFDCPGGCWCTENLGVWELHLPKPAKTRWWGS